MLKLFISISLIFLPLHVAYGKSDERRYDRFVIAGTPSVDELKQFKEQKGAMIVDLRGSDELAQDNTSDIAGQLGLQYGHVSFDVKAKTISPEMITEIDKIVEKSGNKRIMLFCRSGNRASAYLAIHLIRQKKMPADKAISIAKNLGMKDEMAAKVNAYLKDVP